MSSDLYFIRAVTDFIERNVHLMVHNFAMVSPKLHLGYEGPSSEFNPYPTAFPYGNGMVLHFYQQQESSTTKTVHKVINNGLKAYV